ncbi:MAG TPA: hypothetical protein VHL78_13115 [Actinomycetota bacterium]|nr:hypothetical protein [Actinomycetota bacterium]
MSAWADAGAAFQAAALGPAVAALGWLAFARSRPLRRLVGGGLALAAHAAAWWAMWLAYTGQAPATPGLRPTLLGATVAVAAELGILVAATRAEARADAEIPPVIVGLGASASAIVVAASSGSLVVQAVLLPLPTLSVGLAALSVAPRPGVQGLLALAAADAAAAAGLSLAFERSGSTVVGPAGMLPAALLLAAAAVKAGAVPGVGTWRLVAAGGPGSVLASGLRGQAMWLAALAGVVMLGADATPLMAGTAAAAVLLAGLAGLAAARPALLVAAVCGGASALPFLALGLGEAVGGRAFLLLFVPVLLATAAATALGVGPREVPASRAARWGASVALAVAIGSAAGVPPGGAFPGTWLALSLAAERAVASPPHLLVVVAASLGIGLLLLASVPLIRSPARGGPAVLAGALAGAALLYMGAQPVRLGIGWWIRVEREMGFPRLLPAAAGPSLPAIGGLDLALAVAPVAVVIGLVAWLGRGFRDAEVPFAPLWVRRRRRRRPPRPGSAIRRAARSAGRLPARASQLGLGFGAAMVLEAAAVVMAVRLLFVGAQAGFL